MVPCLDLIAEPLPLTVLNYSQVMQIRLQLLQALEIFGVVGGK